MVGAATVSDKSLSLKKLQGDCSTGEGEGRR